MERTHVHGAVPAGGCKRSRAAFIGAPGQCGHAAAPSAHASSARPALQSKLSLAFALRGAQASGHPAR